jgi:hypothetical protein
VLFQEHHMKSIWFCDLDLCDYFTLWKNINMCHNNECHVSITWQCCHMATNIFRNLLALINIVHTLEIIIRNVCTAKEKTRTGAVKQRGSVWDSNACLGSNSCRKAIKHVKSWHIFDQSLPLTLYGSVNQIWMICCMLVNFQKYNIISKLFFGSVFESLQTNHLWAWLKGYGNIYFYYFIWKNF